MQSFRATYGWLGINIASRLLVSWERSSRTSSGRPKKSSYVLHRRWHEEWACEGWLMGTSQPVWPVLRNGRYMIPAHMMSTELAAYLSLPCWYKDDRSGDRDRSLTIPPRREPRNGISYLDQ